MTTAITAAASTTAGTLAPPIRRANSEGSPKTPLPITQLTVSATRLQRPMARTSCGRDEVDEEASGIARLYHKWQRAGQSLAALGLRPRLDSRGGCRHMVRCDFPAAEDHGSSECLRVVPHTRENPLPVRSVADLTNACDLSYQSNERITKAQCTWDIY